MHSRSTLKTFSIPKKLMQHFIVYLISAGIVDAIRDSLKPYPNNPWVNCGIFGPGLVVSAVIYEAIWLVAYKNAPLTNAKELTNGSTTDVLKKLSQKTAIKCVSTFPIAGIAFLEDSGKISLKDTFFRNMLFYIIPATLFAMVGEWIYDFINNSFLSGASIGYQISSQVRMDEGTRDEIESEAIELTKCSLTADSDIAWYQYGARLLDNIVTTISLAEIFLRYGINQSEKTKSIDIVPHLFLILATTLIFITLMTAKWAFTPASKKQSNGEYEQLRSNPDQTQSTSMESQKKSEAAKPSEPSTEQATQTVIDSGAGVGLKTSSREKGSSDTTTLTFLQMKQGEISSASIFTNRSFFKQSQPKSRYVSRLKDVEPLRQIGICSK